MNDLSNVTTIKKYEILNNTLSIIGSYSEGLWNQNGLLLYEEFLISYKIGNNQFYVYEEATFIFTVARSTLRPIR